MSSVTDPGMRFLTFRSRVLSDGSPWCSSTEFRAILLTPDQSLNLPPRHPPTFRRSSHEPPRGTPPRPLESRPNRHPPPSRLIPCLPKSMPYPTRTCRAVTPHRQLQRLQRHVSSQKGQEAYLADGSHRIHVRRGHLHEKRSSSAIKVTSGKLTWAAAR